MTEAPTSGVIISRSEAISRGLPFYFTGRECKHGHIEKRRVRDKACETCRYRLNHDYQLRHRETIAAQKAVYYQENKDKFVKKDREKARAIVRRHYAAHTGEYKARVALRRATKIQATPQWLTEQDRAEIVTIFVRAKDLARDGVKRHVDHIIPLINDIVCGLHVPWNLQILTETENLMKSNKVVQL